jgi:hypothetical protein
MIETLTDLPPGTLGFRASGELTAAEYRQMMEPIYAALERGEKLNIYFELAGDFDVGALFEDLKAAGAVGLKHRSSWQRDGARHRQGMDSPRCEDVRLARAG